MKRTIGSYFVGVYIGIDTVGYAVTDNEYKLLKFKGEPMWGVHTFDRSITGKADRPLARAADLLSDIVKANGNEPDSIYLALADIDDTNCDVLAKQYPKARLVSVAPSDIEKFREKHDLIKATIINDLHRAKDAFLCIAAAEHIVDTEYVQKIVKGKNSAHLTRYAFCRKSLCASFFLLAKYRVATERELMPLPVETSAADKVLEDTYFAEQHAKKTIEVISGKAPDEVVFPWGSRKIKIGSVLEFDNHFRACITGCSRKNGMLSLSVHTPLIVGYEWEKYARLLEDTAIIDDLRGISKEKNLAFFDFLCEKLTAETYKKHPSVLLKATLTDRETFENAELPKQCACLLKIISMFGKHNEDSVLPFSISLWRDDYKDVRIVDMTASGLYQSKTDNILSLL